MALDTSVFAFDIIKFCSYFTSYLCPSPIPRYRLDWIFYRTFCNKFYGLKTFWGDPRRISRRSSWCVILSSEGLGDCWSTPAERQVTLGLDIWYVQKHSRAVPRGWMEAVFQRSNVCIEISRSSHLIEVAPRRKLLRILWRVSLYGWMPRMGWRNNSIRLRNQLRKCARSAHLFYYSAFCNKFNWMFEVSVLSILAIGSRWSKRESYLEFTGDCNSIVLYVVINDSFRWDRATFIRLIYYKTLCN